MSICIRHTRRQAFRWFLNKRDDVANAIKLDCRRLHACFRIFYAPFTVALLVYLRLFVPSLTTNCVFRLKIGGRGRKKSEIKITRFIAYLLLHNVREYPSFANIPFVDPFKQRIKLHLIVNILQIRVVKLVSRFVILDWRW